eukprot:s488_g7.t1
MWRSSRQSVVTLSTAEAELAASVEGALALASVEALLHDLGFEQEQGVLMTDSQSALSIQKGSCSWRTRHLRIKANWVTERLETGALRIEHCPGEQHIADALTKPLAAARLTLLSKLLGLMPLGEIQEEIKASQDALGAARTSTSDCGVKVLIALLVLSQAVVGCDATELTVYQPVSIDHGLVMWCVFAVIALLWTLAWEFIKFAGWQLYYNAGEILSCLDLALMRYFARALCRILIDLELPLTEQASGTSPAAAYAAGAAALLLAEKPDLSPEEVKQALIRRATVGRVSNLGGTPDRLVNSLGGVPKVPNWAEEPEGMWSLVDGGVDRECGGEDDDHAAHYDFEVFTKVKTLEDCKQRCQSAASTMGCAGISYSEEEEKCEVWVQLVRSSVEMTGYLCLRHEAPTKTSTSRTSTSQTTQTRTTTSVTTVTSVTSTRTTTTHTQPPLLADIWSSRKDLNCLVSAGGAQTASGRDYLGVLPKEACIKECAHQKGCDAALIQDFGRVGNCWLRSNVFLDHCTRAPGFTVWTRNPLTLRMKK